MVLRIRPVFQPISPALGLLFAIPSLLLLLGCVALVVGALIAPPTGELLAVAVTMLFLGGLPAAVMALAATAMTLGVRWVELELGTHAIRVTTLRNHRQLRVDVPLAELVSAGVDGETLVLQTRSGAQRFPIPARTERTYAALRTWLAQANERAQQLSEGRNEVPDALRALTARRTEAP